MHTVKPNATKASCYNVSPFQVWLICSSGGLEIRYSQGNTHMKTFTLHTKVRRLSLVESPWIVVQSVVHACETEEVLERRVTSLKLIFIVDLNLPTSVILHSVEEFVT